MSRRKISYSTSTTSESEEDDSSPTMSPAKRRAKEFSSTENIGKFPANENNLSSSEMKTKIFPSGEGQYSNAASRMMVKMGYKVGKGLGVKEQGRVDPVEASKQRGRRGLGLKIQAIEGEVLVDWKSDDQPTVEEHVEWMPRSIESIPSFEELSEWTVEGKKKLTIDDESSFCDEELLKVLLSCKSIFDDLEGHELRNARSRSNPYESIRGAIFLNRAAMKMANMDAVFSHLFSAPKNVKHNEIMYFADVCAGPGGFSEYLLWRRKWYSKGFGFTLKGENDFKLEDFLAADPEFFEPHYGVGGVNGDGDVTNTDNMEEFQDFVMENTNGKGVHFIMADGGFSVEGQENIQEILTKQLLLCQFACALNVVRIDGTFLCKTFDLFTPFSVSLVYLMRRAFENVTIFKPVTSRPANSERYLVCKGYRDPERLIGEYLFSVNRDLNAMKDTERDVISAVPLDILLEDADFCSYMKASNETIAEKQCKALSKIHAYAKDRNLRDGFQANVRRDCLEKWGVPDKVRAASEKVNVKECFNRCTSGMTGVTELTRHSCALTRQTLEKIGRIYDYRSFICAGRRALIVSLGGSRIFEWSVDSRKWIPSPNLNCLIPRNTVLEVDFVNELKGEGKGQRKNLAIHIVDAITLCGEDISRKHYNERMNDVQMFAAALSKKTLPHVNIIRAKNIYRTENIQEVFKTLSMKRVKGYGAEPKLCCSLDDDECYFVPTGLCFTKITKDPWTVAFSRSANRKYFFNTSTRQSSFECPSDFCATYEMCVTSRLFWDWESGVRIHEDQKNSAVHTHNLGKEDVIQFIKQHQ